MHPAFFKGNSTTVYQLLALRRQAQTDKTVRVALRFQEVLMSLAGCTAAEVARRLANGCRHHVHLNRRQKFCSRFCQARNETYRILSNLNVSRFDLRKTLLQPLLA
jgi:hypothetical protein